VNYKIVCNREQLALIQSACEVYARVMMGQIDSILDGPIAHIDIPVDRYLSLSDKICDASKSVWGGGYMSLLSKGLPDSARVAWDIHWSIRHLLAFEANPEGNPGSVLHDTPQQTSQQPLIEVSPTDQKADWRPAKVKMANELAELVRCPPDDFETAVSRIKMWRNFYNEVYGVNHE
jgi:hypothetical protein